MNQDAGGEAFVLRQNINNLMQTKSQLEAEIRNLDTQLHQSQLQVSTTSNEVQILRQKVRILEET